MTTRVHDRPRRGGSRHSSHRGSKPNQPDYAARGRAVEEAKAARYHADNLLQVGRAQAAAAARARSLADGESRWVAADKAADAAAKAQPAMAHVFVGKPARDKFVNPFRPLHYTDPGYAKPFTPRQRRRLQHHENRDCFRPRHVEQRKQARIARRKELEALKLGQRLGRGIQAGAAKFMKGLAGTLGLRHEQEVRDEANRVLGISTEAGDQ